MIVVTEAELPKCISARSDN